MTLKEARELQARIKQTGLHCIVPLGNGPDGYFARIFTLPFDDEPKGDGYCKPRDFYSEEEFRGYEAKRTAERNEREHRIRRLQALSRPRSPIDAMIDRACGIERS